VSLPLDQFGIASYLALLVPGVVFTAVRAALRGFRDVDRSVGAKILQAFVVSVIFDSIYAAILGSMLAARIESGVRPAPEEVTAGAFLFIALGLVVPVLISWVIYGGAPFLEGFHNALGRFRRAITNSRYESTPTAWDLAATRTTAPWVRVRVSPDEYVGGVFAQNSYFIPRAARSVH
jgi:hypothetical protein